MVHRHEQKWIEDYQSCNLYMKIITMENVYNAIKAHCGILKLLLSSLWIWGNLSPKICCKNNVLTYIWFSIHFHASLLFYDTEWCLNNCLPWHILHNTESMMNSLWQGHYAWIVHERNVVGIKTEMNNDIYNSGITKKLQRITTGVHI